MISDNNKKVFTEKAYNTVVRYHLDIDQTKLYNKTYQFKDYIDVRISKNNTSYVTYNHIDINILLYKHNKVISLFDLPASLHFCNDKFISAGWGNDEYSHRESGASFIKSNTDSIDSMYFYLHEIYYDKHHYFLLML